jgi:putative Mn2+ efflux pump MntP
MRALVPSKTALATSLTSARVGVGARSIDSSIWVAVITGRPKATPVRMIRFW